MLGLQLRALLLLINAGPIACPPSGIAPSVFPEAAGAGRRALDPATPPNCSLEKLWWAELHAKRVWDCPSSAGLIQRDLEAGEQEPFRMFGFGMRFLTTGVGEPVQLIILSAVSPTQFPSEDSCLKIYIKAILLSALPCSSDSFPQHGQGGKFCLWHVRSVDELSGEPFFTGKWHPCHVVREKSMRKQARDQWTRLMTRSCYTLV